MALDAPGHKCMRILHVSTRLILGGSQENTVLSCEGQMHLGHDVHLAFGPIYGPEGSMHSRVSAFLTPDNRAVATHEIPSMVREIRPISDLTCYFELRELIRTINPDIVHTHSSKAGILGRLAAWNIAHHRNHNNPLGVVHTIHGPPFHDYQSHTIHTAYVRAERIAAMRCHRIVSVADAMTDQFLAQGIGRKDQYITVRSGMETDSFLAAATPEVRARTRDTLGLRNNDFVIGTVARLAELKGHDDLLDALAGELRAHTDWKLLWIGDGWWRDRLAARVRELGLADRVVMAGLVAPDRVPDMMAAMDVLAHPSYREGLPRTVPQALLTGVCPVAYNVDGTREACQHERTGLLVKPGNTQSLRDAVVRLYRYPALRTQLAQSGQTWCKAQFGARVMVDALERVYTSALDIASRRRIPAST